MVSYVRNCAHMKLVLVISIRSKWESGVNCPGHLKFRSSSICIAKCHKILATQKLAAISRSITKFYISQLPQNLAVFSRSIAKFYISQLPQNLAAISSSITKFYISWLPQNLAESSSST